jgi:hypothetical protein
MRAAPFPTYPLVPEDLDEVKQVFGAFIFVKQSGGLITPDPLWVKASITTIERVPILREPIVCHQKLVRPLLDVLEKILAANLATAIRTCEGCYWPRFKMHDFQRGLSLHSWGIAIDLNAPTNMPGTKGDMDRRIVEIFARHGFYWGGYFGDPMHFQYAHGY